MDQPINWSPGVTLADIEKQVILLAFRFYRGNKTSTAQALGISVRTLDNKFDEYKKADTAEKDMVEHERESRREWLAKHRGGHHATTGTAGPATPAGTPSGQERVHGANAGIRMESASDAPAKQTVPMPERKEVQGMLPAQASKGNPRSAR